MTPIAQQFLDGTAQLKWTELPGAPMTLKQARAAMDRGEILMATKREGNVRTVCIVNRKGPVPASHQPYFQGPDRHSENYYGGPSRGNVRGNR